MKDIKDTTLWQVLVSKANGKQEIVSDFIRKAADRLLLVRDTFPTYTLHNEVHSINVINRMADLLGDEINQINELELVILILSAYYHDIGMVFSPEERNELQNEGYFQEFTETHPGALLKIKEYQSAANETGIPEDVAEWYCRWIHPQRSEDYVKTMNEIVWNGFPINDAVGLVCKSHGYSISDVYKWEELDIDFHTGADLLFCAMLLRLADILDFDNSRSPEEIYRYLGLSGRKTKRESASDTEWRKHLGALGFDFPDKSRKERHPVKFFAVPDEPAVEYDIRQFLDTIEHEIEKCHSVLSHCSAKWKNFKLPSNINRKGIKSKGYTYGDYRFTLEKQQILDLLMGENLYSDTYAFIRELVQNAIDTTRYRTIYEKSKGNMDFEPLPIRISQWTDNDGYTWFRIDDDGMGMDEQIITDYFLKVGKSYYKSEQFQVELLNYKSDFMPISRFGIGVLSCFIIGDRVELNTRKAGVVSRQNALRMTLKGLNDFYILKRESEKHPASLMPNEFNNNEGYRKPHEFGTSIAVRFNPKKETGNFNLKGTLKKYIVCSPIPIIYNDEEVGGNYNDLIEKEWIQPMNYLIDELIQQKIEDTLKMKFSERLSISIQPLPLSKFSPSDNLKGQAIVGTIQLPEKDKLLFEDKTESRGLRINWYDFDENVELIAYYEHWEKAGKFNKMEIELQYDIIQRKIENLEYSRRNFPELNIYQVCRDLRDIIELKNQTEEYTQIKNFVSAKISNNEIKQLFEEALKYRTLKLDYQDATREYKMKLSEFTTQLKQSIPQLNYHWISHNGIVVPTEGKEEIFEIGNPVSNGFFWYNIALKDALRPDLSLSRDEIKGISWQIYSDISLMIFRATGSFMSKDEDLRIFDRLIGSPHFLYSSIAEDKNIKDGNGWINEPFISTDKGTVSVNQIKKGIENGMSYKINAEYDISETYSNWLSFLDICRMAILQKHLSLRLDTKEDKLIAEKVDTSTIIEAYDFYPPMFFVEYDTDKIIRHTDNPINKKHPFSIWLINNTRLLAEKHPGLLENIKQNLATRSFRSYRINTLIKNINQILQILIEINFEGKPDKSIFLTEEDFII